MKTSDIGFATALAAMGCPLDGVEFTGRTAHFIFHEDVRIELLEQLYFDGKLFVDGQAYHNNYRRLMARVKNGQAEY